MGAIGDLRVGIGNQLTLADAMQGLGVVGCKMMRRDSPSGAEFG